MAVTDYPHNFPEVSSVQGSYADENDTQRLMMSYQIDNPRVTKPEQSGVLDVRHFLVQVSAEIDAILLVRGVSVPPPANTQILPILTQYCAFGAVALIEHQRFETGDESIGNHATAMLNLYAQGLGLLENEEFNLVQLGCVSAGWAVTPVRKLRYSSGNLEALPDGVSKTPFFTMQTQW